MPTTEYSDEAYEELVRKIQRLVEEFLEMDGNDEQLLRDEIDNAIENV